MGVGSSGGGQGTARPTSKRRWISLGIVRRGYQVIGNCGFPRAWAVHWAGRADWCQPWRFYQWRHLMRTAETLLALRRLRPVAWQIRLNRVDWPDGTPLRVLVARIH